MTATQPFAETEHPRAGDGKFAAKQRAESPIDLTAFTSSPAKVFGDYAEPAADAAHVSPDVRNDIATQSRRAADDSIARMKAFDRQPGDEAVIDSTRAYEEALAHAEAMRLCSWPCVLKPHEVAWSADQYVEDVAHRREVEVEETPASGMSAEHAAAVCEHFLRRCLDAARTQTQPLASDRHRQGRAAYLVSGARYAATFGLGREATTQEVARLREALLASATDDRTPALHDRPPTLEEARAVWTAAMSERGPDPAAHL